jgi:hypothetical protein
MASNPKPHTWLLHSLTKLFHHKIADDKFFLKAIEIREREEEEKEEEEAVVATLDQRRGNY